MDDQLRAMGRAARTEVEAGLDQELSDPAGARGFLVQDSEDLRPLLLARHQYPSALLVIG